MALVEAERLSKTYRSGAGGVAALGAVSFEIGAGEFVAVTGPSGSGKTTLMNLIGLLDSPSGGRLRLGGEDAVDLPADRRAAIRNRRIGFVFQNYNLLPRNTAVENVELPLVYAGLGRRARRRRAEEVLAAVGLSPRRDHWPSQLSGGEQQRVAVARALACRPDVILADEPTGSLDSATGASVLALFQWLNRDGHTVVLVSHDETVARHAGRIIGLSDGMVVFDRRVERPLDAASGGAAPGGPGPQPQVRPEPAP